MAIEQHRVNHYSKTNEKQKIFTDNDQVNMGHEDYEDDDTDEVEDLETGAARMEKAHIDVSTGASYIGGITPDKNN